MAKKSIGQRIAEGDVVGAKGAGSRLKGGRFEREIIGHLQPIISSVYAELREPLALPPATPELMRNSLQWHRGGDDICPNKDWLGPVWFSFECKFQETLNLKGWWDQTKAQARPGQLPVLLYKQSRKPIRVRTWVYLDNGLKVLGDISIDAFKAYFEQRLRDELVAFVQGVRGG